MKKISVTLMLIFIGNATTTCQTIQQYKNKTYIFDAYEPLHVCDISGKLTEETVTALKGSLFSIVRITDDKKNAIIVFNTFKVPKKENSNKYLKASLNQHLYNYKDNYYLKNANTNDKEKVLKISETTGGPSKDDSSKSDPPNMALKSLLKIVSSPVDYVKYFLLPLDVFANSASEYVYNRPWDISFGTITTPFKFRSHPALFSNNVNLGGALSYQYKVKRDFSLGFVFGLSLTSVTLDTYSLDSTITTTERPAFTPSISAMLGYKNINLTFGIGWDFINRTSAIERKWAYNCNRWFGIGLGVNLFSSNSSTSQTKTTDQKE